MSTNLHPMLNVAIKAARAAGAVINRAALDVENVRVAQKQVNDFVTEVDHAAEQAIIETYEEAGVLGDLMLPGVGRYVYAKNGSDHLVEVFLLQVDRVLDRWPESTARHRSWLPMETAFSIQGRDEARLICRDAAARLRELADRQLLFALGSVSFATPEGLSALADRAAIGEAV